VIQNTFSFNLFPIPFHQALCNIMSSTPDLVRLQKIFSFSGSSDGDDHRVVSFDTSLLDNSSSDNIVGSVSVVNHERMKSPFLISVSLAAEVHWSCFGPEVYIQYQAIRSRTMFISEMSAAVPIVGYGTIKMIVGGGHEIILHDDVHIPSIPQMVLSVRKFT
jgi:hypothetical protein